MEWIARYRKAVMLAIAMVFAVGAGTASAYFTAQTQIPENVIRAGTVELASVPATSAISIDCIAPGATVTRSLKVVNDGTLPVDAVVTGAKKMGITDFYNALLVRVRQGDRELYNGPLSALRTAPVRIAAAGSQQLEFDVTLPADAGDDLAGDYVKLTLYVDAEQVR